MGESILKGISAALGVTAITLLVGLLWTAMGLGGLSTSTLVDIGLIASCIAAGYVTGKESGQWSLGGVSGLGYVLLCVLLVALFLELRAWGVIQVLAEGGLIGILAGAFGAGSGGKRSRSSAWRAPQVSLWGDSYNSRGFYSGSGTYNTYYGFSREDADSDGEMDHWDDLLNDEREWSDVDIGLQGKNDHHEDLWEEEQWSRDTKSSRTSRFNLDKKDSAEHKWGKKAWWEEDVL